MVRTALTADEMAAQADFDISLKLRNREELEARVNRGEIFSRAALEAYLPNSRRLRPRFGAWLVAQGFKITLEADSGMRFLHTVRMHKSRRPLACNWRGSPPLTVSSHRLLPAPSVPDEIGRGVSRA